MKKACNIIKKLGGGGCKLKTAYTLAEVVVVMLVVAVVVSVSIKITKVKLDNIISYTYYAGYSTLRSVTGQILADFKSTDDDYLDKEAMIMPKTLLSLIMPLQKARAGELAYFCATDTYAANEGSGGMSVGGCDVKPSTSPVGLNCETRCKKWYERHMAVNTEFKICPGKHVYQDENTRKYWDYNSSDWVTIDYPHSHLYWDDNGPYYDSIYKKHYRMEYTSCDQPCGDGTNNCGTRMLTTYPHRFFCVGADNVVNLDPITGGDHFTTSLEGTLNAWPICVGRFKDPTPENPEPETCATPSEAEQQVHRCQNQEEWKGEPTCGYVPITCPEGNHWSVNSCGCVPESPTLPRKGINFCRKFVSYTNTKSNSPECTGTAISSTETDFSDKTADITLRNGMRIYNMSQNPQGIGILEGNTQGASYDGVPNINTFGYTVYLDIDGEKGASTLWEDVYKFYITMAGKVIPAYDENNPNEEVGGNSRRHLMTSVEKEAIVDGRRQMRWLKKSVSFKEGACTSNYLGASSRYCNGVNLLPDCNDPINPCFMKHISPVKFF